MKYIFYSFWAILSLLSGGLTLIFLISDASIGPMLALALVGFYSFCFYRLIQSAYPAEPLLDNADVCFWLYWLFVPISIYLIKDGIKTIITDTYISSSNFTRLLSRFMLWLAENFGAWLPGTIVLLIGLFALAFCSRGIMGYRKMR